MKKFKGSTEVSWKGLRIQHALERARAHTHFLTYSERGCRGDDLNHFAQGKQWRCSFNKFLWKPTRELGKKSHWLNRQSPKKASESAVKWQEDARCECSVSGAEANVPEQLPLSSVRGSDGTPGMAILGKFLWS